MSSDTPLFEELGKTVSGAVPRIQKRQMIATLIRNSGDYRWVGLYEIDERACEVINLVWDGPGPPEYPRFPILLRSCRHPSGQAARAGRNDQKALALATRSAHDR